MFNLDALFWQVDEFCQSFEPQWHQQQLLDNPNRRQRRRRLSLSEIMTLLIAYHQSDYRCFKQFYLKHVCCFWRQEFPQLVSYNRFVEWMPSTVVPLYIYLRSCFGRCSGISFIDATSLRVCHNRRIHSHRALSSLAARGKTSVGWFYGFKLHLVINHKGELLECCLTPGNTDDRHPTPQLLSSLFGKVFADKGYISHKLAQTLRHELGIQLITRIRRNMNNQLMLMSDKLLLRHRGVIESVIEQLKNCCNIEHSRHRSPANFMVNLLSGLIAYCHKPNKPSLDLNAFTLPNP